MSNNPVPRLTSVDLFAGCGGLTRGLEDAGFECIAFNELNHDAAASFIANFPNATPYVGPIGSVLTDIELENILKDPRINGSIDLICGGPPCQGYSGIGHRRTHNVEKESIPTNHLYKEMARVIRTLSPKAFLFENVKGILSGKWTKDGENGEIFWDVWDEFASIEGYTLQPALLKGYGFGVPQNRPRVMILGVKKEYLLGKGILSKIILPDILARKDLNWRTTQSKIENPGGLFPKWKKNIAPDLIDVIGDLDYEGWTKEDPFYPHKNEDKLSEFQIEMRHGVDDKNSVENHTFSNHKPDTIEKFQYMIDHQVRKMEQMPKKWRTKKFSQRVTPKRWAEKETPWITVTSLADDYVHYARPRSFSVREWARIQTFPDRHVFRGKRTTGGERRAGNPSEGVWDRDLPLYTQIGNAVPPKLALNIGLRISELLQPKKPSPAHIPLGPEVAVVDQIISIFDIGDYATVRITPRALGHGNASGGDSDAPVNLRNYLSRNSIVDYDSILPGGPNGSVINAKLVSKSHRVEEIKINFSRTKGRGRDTRFWPRSPFKHRCNGNQRFGGDLLLFSILNNELTVFIVQEFTILELEYISENMNLPSWRSNLISLVDDMVNIHEKGWVESYSSEHKLKQSDKDVGWTLERELGMSPNSSKKPDYKDSIEVKSTSKMKKSLETIVCKVPGIGVSKSGNWKGGLSERDICLNYGTLDSKKRKFALKNDISCEGYNSHGLCMEVNHDKQRIEVKDTKLNILCVYDFERLKHILETKHPTTLWAKAEKSKSGDKFRYNQIEITSSPNFNSFLHTIERGEIIFDFRMHLEHSKSKVRQHGPAFRIKSDKKNRTFFRFTTLNLSELSTIRKSSQVEYQRYIQDIIFSN